MTLSAGDRIENIYYASEEHRNESFLSLSYEDKGEILILDGGLEFIGEKISLTMMNIRVVKQCTRDSRDLGDWIQIIYDDDKGETLTANLIRLDDQILMGNKKENTSELCQDLIELFPGM